MYDPTLFSRLGLAVARSSTKASLLECESGLRPARNTYPTRYKPDRACLEESIAVAARRTYGIMAVVESTSVIRGIIRT